MHIQHIIWDWNGTLLDDVAHSVHSINQVLAARHMPSLTQEQYRATFGFPVVDYYRRLGFDFEQESFESIGTDFIERYDYGVLSCRLHHHALLVMDTLALRDIGHSVLSARKAQQLSVDLRHFGLHTRLSSYSGLDHHYATSKLENGQRMLQDLGLPAHQVLLIGDTLHDAEVARDLGIQALLFTQGHQNRDTLLQAKVPLIDNLAELLHLLQ